jgi:hypothetical protein
MKIITVKMPDAQSVAAGQTAVFNCPIGRSYLSLNLNYAGVTLAQILAVRVKGNGATLMELGTGTEIDARNQFDGLEAAAGILLLNFQRESLHDPVQRMLTKIGTGFVHTGADAPKNALELKSLQVEIDIDAAAAAPVFSLYAQQSGPEALNLVRRVLRFTHAGASGLNEIATPILPKNTTQHAQYNRIFIKAANITDIELVKDEFSLFKRTKALNERFQKDGWRVPQSGYLVVDPTEDGLGTNSIDVFDAQDFRMKFTLSGAETVTYWIETLGIL